MIWLTTLFMLIICVHLVRQALFEKRRYEASIADGATDADEGLFMQATRRFSIDAPETAVALSDENSILGRTVSFVDKHSARISNAVERKAAQSRVRDDSSSLFARATKTVGQKMDQMSNGLEHRIQTHQMQGPDEDIRSPLSDDTLLARIASKIRERDEKIDIRIREKAERMTLHTADSSQPEQHAYFNRIVARVARRLDTENSGFFGTTVNRVGAFIDRHPVGKVSVKEDFIIRTSRKLGERVHAFDERFINRFRNTTGPDTQH